MSRITFEHKSLNQMLADALDAGFLPEEYRPQCEAGLMVSGAERCLFMASKDGDKTTMRQFWYESNPELRTRIIAACKQFNEDVADYQHIERLATSVAATIEALPALFVQVEGKVLATNLDAFKAAAQTFIANIKTELVCDQDFADADKMVKFLKDGEERLALAKSQALAQTASIDELFRTVDAISEQMRSKRLALDRLVKAEKENRRAEIVGNAVKEMHAHVSRLNVRLGGNWMPTWSLQVFSDAIKGLKSINSMRDNVSAALANEKIAANEIADRIELNKRELINPVEGELDWDYLFPDFSQVCTKPTDDFSALLAMRIAAEEKRKESERAEAEARTAAAVAAAVEAERMAEAKRVAAAAEAATKEAVRATAQAKAQAVQDARDNDQRGKAEEATHAEPKATATPQAPSVSTPPPSIDESIINDFVNLLAITPMEKKQLRLHLQAWEKYRTVRMMREAA